MLLPHSIHNLISLSITQMNFTSCIKILRSWTFIQTHSVPIIGQALALLTYKMVINLKKGGKNVRMEGGVLLYLGRSPDKVNLSQDLRMWGSLSCGIYRGWVFKDDWRASQSLWQRGYCKLKKKKEMKEGRKERKERRSEQEESNIRWGQKGSWGPYQIGH